MELLPQVEPKRNAPDVVTEEQLMAITAIASQPIKRSKKAAKIYCLLMRLIPAEICGVDFAPTIGLFFYNLRFICLISFIFF